MRVMAGSVLLWEGALKLADANQGGWAASPSSAFPCRRSPPTSWRHLAAAAAAVAAQDGNGAVLHEVRSEWAPLATSWFLLLAGPGPWSLDATLARWRSRPAGRRAPVEEALPAGRASARPL